MLTPIYHLNVNPRKDNNPESESLGHISVSIINLWNPNATIREILHNYIVYFIGQIKILLILLREMMNIEKIAHYLN